MTENEISNAPSKLEKNKEKDLIYKTIELNEIITTKDIEISELKLKKQKIFLKIKIIYYFKFNLLKDL